MTYIPTPLPEPTPFGVLSVLNKKGAIPRDVLAEGVARFELICGQAEINEFGCAVQYDKQPMAGPQEAASLPFYTWSAQECSLISDVEQNVRSMHDAGLERALTQFLYDFFMQYATDMGAFTDTDAAMNAMLEGIMNKSIVWADQGTAQVLMANQHVIRVGDHLETQTGHLFGIMSAPIGAGFILLGGLMDYYANEANFYASRELKKNTLYSLVEQEHLFLPGCGGVKKATFTT